MLSALFPTTVLWSKLYMPTRYISYIASSIHESRSNGGLKEVKGNSIYGCLTRLHTARWPSQVGVTTKFATLLYFNCCTKLYSDNNSSLGIVLVFSFSLLFIYHKTSCILAVDLLYSCVNLSKRHFCGASLPREPVPAHLAALHESVPDERVRHGPQGRGGDHPGLRQRQTLPGIWLRRQASPGRKDLPCLPSGERRRARSFFCFSAEPSSQIHYMIFLNMRYVDRLDQKGVVGLYMCRTFIVKGESRSSESGPRRLSPGWKEK